MDSLAKTIMIESVGIIGVGMIGGSIAYALREQQVCQTIVGIDANPDALAWALNANLIDQGWQQISDCPQAPQVVILCVPVAAMREVFGQCTNWFEQGVVITDVGSSKQSVIADLQSVTTTMPSNFVPAHPIAGREQSGVQAAQAGLFAGKKVIITPTQQTSGESLMQITELWQQIGAEVEYMNADSHDQILAATSHLPHALAFALVECLAKQTHTPEIFRYAAGGFADFTRIASSDPALWRDICLANQPALIDAIECFEATLKKLRVSLQDQDSETLLSMFQEAKHTRDKFNQS